MMTMPLSNNKERKVLSLDDVLFLTETFHPLEVDPNGLPQNSPGAKVDAGKADVSLLFESFPNALLAVAEVATFGANKYTRGGWKEVPNGLQRYESAGGRHKLYRHKGEEFDTDSKLPHFYHEAWNALAILEFYIKEKQCPKD